MAVNPWELIKEIEGIQQGIGDWVASGTPATAIGGAIQQRMRNRCDEWSNAPGWITNLSPIGGATIDNVCSPWLTQNGSGGPVLGSPYPTDGTVFNARPYGGIRFTIFSNAAGTTLTINALEYRFSGASSIQYVLCNGQSFDRGAVNLSTFNVVSLGACSPYTGPPPPSVPRPNPNPRPLPPPSPTDEPYTEPGEDLPRIPLPPFTGPTGVQVELPDFVFPGEEPQPIGGGGYDPTAPVNPGTPSTGTGSPDGGNPDEEFGDPPEGEIWVGFTVELLNQDRTQAGFIPSAQPETVYAQPVGGVYALLDIDGEDVVGPYVVIRNLRTTWLSPNPGLNLKGARIHLKFQGTQYEITPLSQPKGDA